MGVETAQYISDLDKALPTGGDDFSQGDDHLRLIKSVLQNTFANITGSVLASHTELNLLDGVTGTIYTTTNKPTLADLGGSASDHNHDADYLGITAQAADSLLLNGQAASYYRNADNLNAGTVAATRLPAATTGTQGAVELATTAEIEAGTAGKVVTADGLAAASTLKPTFITPVSVATGTASVGWTSFDVGTLGGAPSTATMAILQMSGEMDNPDGGDEIADILLRKNSSGPSYWGLRGKAGGGGDEIAWVNQGFYPMDTDQTMEYSVEAPGFNGGWALQIIGYW